MRTGTSTSTFMKNSYSGSSAFPGQKKSPSIPTINKVLRGFAIGLIFGLIVLLSHGPLFAQTNDERAEYAAQTRAPIPERHRLISNELLMGIDDLPIIRIQVKVGETLLVKLVWDDTADHSWDLVSSVSIPEDASRGAVVTQDGVLGYSPASAQPGSTNKGVDFFVFQVSNVGRQELQFEYGPDGFSSDQGEKQKAKYVFKLALDAQEPDHGSVVGPGTN